MQHNAHRAQWMALFILISPYNLPIQNSCLLKLKKKARYFCLLIPTYIKRKIKKAHKNIQKHSKILLQSNLVVRIIDTHIKKVQVFLRLFFLFIGWISAFVIAIDSAGAFPLPPNVISKSYVWSVDLRNLPQRKASLIEVITRNVQVLGGIKYQNSERRLSVLSSGLDSIENYSMSSSRHYSATVTKSPPLSQNSTWLYDFFEKPLGGLDFNQEPQVFRVGAYHFKTDRQRIHLLSAPRAGVEIWALDFSFEAMGIDLSPTTSITAWTSLPRPQLFFLPHNFAHAYRYEWEPSSQVLRYWECSRDRQVVVENLENSYARFVFFKGASGPVSHTIFDFSSETIKRSEMSAVVSLGSCEDFVVAGSFGLIRVRFPHQF
jgi:hypothetical protein